MQEDLTVAKYRVYKIQWNKIKFFIFFFFRYFFIIIYNYYLINKGFVYINIDVFILYYNTLELLIKKLIKIANF